MAPTPFVLGQPFGAEQGLPPWDGTGIPLPVDSTGWPVVPDDLLPAPRIEAPEDGDTVDPLVDITGVANVARAGESIELWVNTSPGAAVATTTIAADGSFIFNGDTPLDVAEETFWVKTEDGQTSAHVTVTVDLPEQAPAAASFAPDAAIVTGADGKVIPPDEDGYASLSAADEDTPLDLGYDPGEHTVAEVQDYLAENPDQTEHVLDRERAGKSRVTLIGD